MRFSPMFSILATNVFLSGVGFAATVPYRSIVGVETLGLSNAVFATVMVLNALGGAAAAVLLGWLSDKVGDRRWLVMLCAAVGGLGFGLIWAVPTPLVFITSFCLLIPFGGALFSQSFSYSRVYYDEQESGKPELMMSMLRTVFTVAWVVIPPVAGWIAAETDAFAVFALAAAAHVGSTILIGLLFLRPEARIGARGGGASIIDAVDLPKASISPSHRIGILGVTLGATALQLNMVVLPLVILHDLGGTLTEVGINAAVAAAIEVPLMIGWGYLALRMRKETILAISCAVLALYSGLMVVAQSVLHVLLLQGLAAISFAALLSISISYLQEAIKGRVGLSTSLMDVTRVIAVVGASVVFALNPGSAYGPLMGVAAVLGIAAAVLMLAAGRTARREAVPA